jgi:hypothetical protein
MLNPVVHMVTLTWQLDRARNIVAKRRSSPLTGTTVCTAGLSPLYDLSLGQLNPYHRISPRVFKINPTRSQCASPLLLIPTVSSTRSCTMGACSLIFMWTPSSLGRTGQATYNYCAGV